MSIELKKRIFTSIILFFIMFYMYNYNYVLISSLILISAILWIEFNLIISKIFKKKNFKNSFLYFLLKFSSLIYISFFSIIVWLSFNQNLDYSEKTFYLYILFVCIFTDIGGMIFGKLFKGPKLTKISPNKTVYGSAGSLISSFILMTIFYLYITNIDLFYLFMITLSVSLSSKLGDLFISFLKRKAKIKDTSNLLPGHGGLLDRLDGILIGLPIGFTTSNLIIIL